MKVKDGDVIVVWFSCGAASAVAAKKTIDRYQNCVVRIVNNPVAEEDEDNRRFLHDIEKWLGVKIESATNDKFPSCSAVDVWEHRRAMSFPNGAPCTIELKKMARRQWEERNHADWHVLGFTAEEKSRHDNFIRTERKNLLPVLIDLNMTKEDCAMVLIDAGIKLPRVYSESSDFGTGYPNANCIGCVKATSPTYWNHVRQTRPDVFAARAEQSRRLGVRLVRCKGERIFLDELDPAARGRDMKNMNFECGIFCEEKI